MTFTTSFSSGKLSLSSVESCREQLIGLRSARVIAAAQWQQKPRDFRAIRAILEPSTGNGSYKIVTGPTSVNSPTNALLSPSTQGLQKSVDQSDNSIQSQIRESDLWAETIHRTERMLKEPTDNLQMNQWIKEVREYFRTMTLGEISMSPYDTAWVARVPALDGSQGPQFPRSLQWIIDHQLPDGDWGEPSLFFEYDRACTTLACLVALKTWEVGWQNVERGIEFLQSNIHKMEEDDDNHMPIGFEIVFPAMLNDAKELGLDLPYDSPILQKIAAEREKKIKKIPMAMLQKYPTTFLHSLEGLHKDVDWDKLLKLQSDNGIFLFSPASTACALMYTKDAKCFDYLSHLLDKFDNACPNVYPVHVFEHLWIVDRLERLGISRYFQREVRDCLQYVYQYWKDDGIGWANNSIVQDVDDTAMAFRLLRKHGFDVKEDCFRQFFKDTEFFCSSGQSGRAVTGMFNLSRASQTLFPGETLLKKARTSTQSFLAENLENNEYLDKRIIIKGISGEVQCALTYPWYASLDRIEHRSYLDQHGPDDIWISKSLYRMPAVTNEVFLKLAKADFNMCQALHRKEVEQVVEWSSSFQFGDQEFGRNNSVECYFSAAATMFEPEMAQARLVWTRYFVLAIVLDDYFDGNTPIEELRTFLQAVRAWDPKEANKLADRAKILFSALYDTVNSVAQEALMFQKRDVSHHLRHYWSRWLTSILTEAEWAKSGYIPTFDEYMGVAGISSALKLVAEGTIFFVGQKLDEDVLDSRDYHHIMDLVGRVGRILNDIQGIKRKTSEEELSSVKLYMHEHPEATTVAAAVAHLHEMVDNHMQQLTYEMLHFTAVPKSCKRIVFYAAKICHTINKDTGGYSLSTAMSELMKMILFEPVSE